MRDMPSPIKPRFAPYPDLEEFLEPFVARGLDSLENTVAVRGVNVPINLKSARNKFKQLLFQFEGKPELAVVHALLISASRKDSWPESAQAYFMDMWAKKPDCLYFTALDADASQRPEIISRIYYQQMIWS